MNKWPAPSKELLDNTPEPLKSWSQQNETNEFSLTKVDGKDGRMSQVDSGRKVMGYFELVEVQGKIAVRVSRSFDYIRTSPVIRLMDFDEQRIVFETEGGYYLLEKHSS